MELEINFKKVGDYSPEELKQFREMFAVDLERYRTEKRRFMIPLTAAIVVGLVAFFWGMHFYRHKWVAYSSIVLAGGGGLTMAAFLAFLQNKLRCPACHNLFVDAIQKYCPECGCDSLEPRNWLIGGYHCESCGKDIMIGKSRNFKYKACTHCGVFLDEEGV
jgi:RNA polymerase subunit RPABC4/transcription elongation factor Spt4